MEVDLSIYRSPKRKRGQSTPGPSLHTSGLSQSLSTSTEQLDDVGCHSPSTKVTGKFQKLDLQSPIDLPPPIASHDHEHEELPHKTSAPAAEIESSPEFKPPETAEFTFESPVLANATMASPTTASPGRIKSPPPSSVVSDQFWQASEITGWSPGDPDEDNYGVNGVGYAKSASKAWAISQKRKQQIAEYRNRETREARQRRHERRLSGFNSRRGSPMGSPKPGATPDASGETGDEATGRKGVRFVHFEDG